MMFAGGIITILDDAINNRPGYSQLGIGILLAYFGTYGNRQDKK